MTRITRTAAWAAAGIVGGGAAAGIAYAAVTTPAAAGQNTTPTATVTAPAHQPRGAGGAAAGLGRRALLHHLEHGQLTLAARAGERTVDLQRGKVDTVSATSVHVVSPDGFARTYTVTRTTRVRGASGREAISAVHPGDTVLVVATAGAALRILDR